MNQLEVAFRTNGFIHTSERKVMKTTRIMVTAENRTFPLYVQTGTVNSIKRLVQKRYGKDASYVKG